MKNLNKKMERQGETFINNHGNVFTIEEYVRAGEVIVRFECGYTNKTSYKNCQLGKVYCPYDKRYCGVACIGLMSDGTEPIITIDGRETKAYKAWCNMIYRVYCESQLKHHPSYRNCTVCERWLTYSNFLEDIHLIPNYDQWLVSDDYELDKDLLQKGVKHKIYSLNTCVFIPRSLNMYEANTRPRIKKEKPYKPTKVIRVTNIETGEFEDYKKQEEVADAFRVKQSYISRLISKGKEYQGYKIEILYV